MAAYPRPGVYRQDVFVKPQLRLPTGVPGFVGFAGAVGAHGPAVNVPVALQRKEEFAALFGSLPGSFLGDAVVGFFDNGGVRCHVVRADPGGSPVTALAAALASLGALTDVDLVAVPDAVGLSSESDTQLVQREVLAHCAAHGDRMALLDGLHGATPDAVLAQRSAVTMGGAEPVNGALYYPWVRIAAGGGGLRSVPPCGHVAGIVARTDARVGVFKAPANEEVLGIFDLDLPVDDAMQDQLNPEGINCLRAFPGRAIRVWGARTLSRQPEWLYINVRRLFLTLRRWIDLNMAWATFEPNTPRLWVRIRRELTAYLTTLWRDGGLLGEVPEQAFYVKCDGETNPPELREQGSVVTEIGLAPSSPAEFVVVRIIHREADETAG